MAKRKPAPSAGVDIFSTGSAASGMDQDSRWWLGDRERVHEKLVATARRIIRNQAGQDQADRDYLAMYYGASLNVQMPYAITRAVGAGRGKRLTYNIVKSIIDAFAAQMVQSKPKATFLTSDGDWDLQQRAKGMEKWTDGMLHDLGFYDVRRQCWTDAGIWGDGVWKVWEERESEGAEGEPPVDAIKLERVQAPMLVADEGECRDGKPRSIYERRWVDRLVAMAAWPERATEIRNARRNDADEQTPGFDSTSDQILLWEAFHLPSRRGAGDGLHAICIESAVLFSEPYEAAPTPSGFPYVRLRRVDPPTGFRAISGAEELAGAQKELTTLVTKRQRGLHLVGAPHWVVEKGSVTITKIDNAIGSIIEVKPGSMVPQSVVPPAVGPELQQVIAELYSKAFELFGITQLQAQGLKPAGLDSGEAQRVYNNTASQRFKVAQENDERAVLETVRLIMWCAEKIIARGGEVAVKAVRGRAFEKLSFEDIRLAEEEHVLQMFPTSALANEPAERTQQVADWTKAGWIDPSAAKRLLNFPDLEAHQSLANANYDATMQMIDDILERGHFVGPTALLDLGTSGPQGIQPGESVKLFNLALIKAMRTGVSGARIDMMHRWLQMAKDIVQPPPSDQPKPPPAQAGPPPMSPQAPPGPPAGPVPQEMPPQGAPPGVPVQ